MHIDIKNTAYKSVKHLFFLMIPKAAVFYGMCQWTQPPLHQ